MIYNQIVTWTAFAILAMFSLENCNFYLSKKLFAVPFFNFIFWPLSNIKHCFHLCDKMILAHKGGEVMTRMMMMTPGGDELVCVGGKSVHPLRDQGQLGQQQGRGGAEEHQEEQAAAS